VVSTQADGRPCAVTGQLVRCTTATLAAGADFVATIGARTGATIFGLVLVGLGLLAAGLTVMTLIRGGSRPADQ
jgi:hypothetical protein